MGLNKIKKITLKNYLAVLKNTEILVTSCSICSKAMLFGSTRSLLVFLVCLLMLILMKWNYKSMVHNLKLKINCILKIPLTLPKPIEKEEKTAAFYFSAIWQFLQKDTKWYQVRVLQAQEESYGKVPLWKHDSIRCRKKLIDFAVTKETTWRFKSIMSPKFFHQYSNESSRLTQSW